jgi:hypothetical protein
LVFLIVLIVATTVLIAWLLVELARLTLGGDLRFPKLREGSVQSAPSAGPALPAVGGSPTQASGDDSDADPARRKADRIRGRRKNPREELLLHDETDVEMAVRDRLYGRPGRRD